MSAQRINTKMLEQLRQQLSDRDNAVLQSIRIYRLLQVHHVQRLHFIDHANEDSAGRVCRRVLKRLAGQKLIVRLDRRIGGQRAGSAGFVYSLSPLGHRLLKSPTRRRHREPSFGFITHTLAIAELATNLIRLCWAESLTAWQIQTEPSAWREFHGEQRIVTLKPDLAVTVTDEEFELRWFVEIDLSTESRTTIERKCQTYTDYWRSGVEQEGHGVFPRTLWVAPSQERADQLRRSIELGAGIEPALFTVTTADTALDVLTDFGDDPD